MPKHVLPASHSWSKWQPNNPRPPQLLRGVSIRSRVCPPSFKSVTRWTWTDMFFYKHCEHLLAPCLIDPLTPSFRCTVSATFRRSSWLLLSTFPNLLMRSPALRPDCSAGLPGTTLFTLANTGLEEPATEGWPRPVSGEDCWSIGFGEPFAFIEA